MANEPKAADQELRGVVLGSSWRLIGKIIETPGGDPSAWGDPSYWPVSSCQYHPQVYSIDALVRRCLLYFDRLEWPINNLMPQGELLHGEYLEDRGIIHRTKIDFPNVEPFQVDLLKAMIASQITASVSPGSIPEFIANAHIEIFRHMEISAPGRWAFATVGDGLDSPPLDAATKYRTGLIELFDSLPVPRSDVPYDEMLSFKQKYRSELLALRASMDAAYRSIENDVDRPLARNAEIEKLEKALVDLRDSMAASGFRYWLAYCGIEFSVPEIRELGVKAGAAYALGGSSTVALVVAAASCIKFSPKLRRSPIEVPDGLKYIHDARRAEIVGDI